MNLGQIRKNINCLGKNDAKTKITPILFTAAVAPQVISCVNYRVTVCTVCKKLCNTGLLCVTKPEYHPLPGTFCYGHYQYLPCCNKLNNNLLFKTGFQTWANENEFFGLFSYLIQYSLQLLLQRGSLSHFLEGLKFLSLSLEILHKEKLTL